MFTFCLYSFLSLSSPGSSYGNSHFLKSPFHTFSFSIKLHKDMIPQTWIKLHQHLLQLFNILSTAIKQWTLFCSSWTTFYHVNLCIITPNLHFTHTILSLTLSHFLYSLYYETSFLTSSIISNYPLLPHLSNLLTHYIHYHFHPQLLLSSNVSTLISFSFLQSSCSLCLIHLD